MSYRVAYNQSIEFAVAGNAGLPLENVAWTILSGAEIADLAADGASATFTGKGAAGTVEAQVTADARIGEGEKALTATFSLDFVAPEARELVLTASEPVDIDPVPADSNTPPADPSAPVDPAPTDPNAPPADPASGPDPALDPTPLPDPTSTPVL